jgi:diaminopimelate epimerase
MLLYFTKMQGLGNDYIYVTCLERRMQWLEKLSSDAMRRLVRKASHRHTGIGADGMILILPSEAADCRMKMYNADGSEGAMCGNGLRCVAKYVHDRGFVMKNEMRIETDSGVREVFIREKDGRTATVRVDMGVAENQTEIQVAVDGQNLPGQLVSTGNPHCVFFVEHIQDFPLSGIGSQMQKMPEFAGGINVEIAECHHAGQLAMRVFERGSGETMACGTGACAVCAAAVWQGYCRYDENIEIIQPGGRLVTAFLADGRILMEGPAEFICEGVYFIKKSDLF